MPSMVIAGLIFGAVLELTGLALAAVGFRRTWTEHGRGEDFWAPVKRGARATVRRAEKIVRRLFRRPRRHEVVAGAAHMRAAAAGESARGFVGWAPLPDPAEDGQAFAAVVHERLNRLHSMIQDDQHALAEERKAREGGEAKLRTELAELGTLVDTETASVAVGGLRLQVLGWSFVLLGIVVGSIANVAASVAM